MAKYKKISEDQWETNYIYWLARDVLVVASVNIQRKDERFAEWGAYVGAAKEEFEWERIRKHGGKLPKAVAEAIFPFSETHVWRG